MEKQKAGHGINLSNQNADGAGAGIGGGGAGESSGNDLDCLVDMREYDVPYDVRVAIDLGVRVGNWYEVDPGPQGINMTLMPDMLVRADPCVCAFDIECTKSPLKFPDATVDQIFMISYMIDGLGHLIINREIVSEDILDFEYTPKPEYAGPFQTKNVANEEELLRAWFTHMAEVRPHIYTTFNGDFFDWPFIEDRARVYGIDMYEQILVKRKGPAAEEFTCHFASHLDCFKWVKRDSYLPQGSQGLKSVTKHKLGYDPVEIEPEKMVQFAQDNPQQMAAYSVSDAVATYYLFMKYVFPFIFSLCTIIPMKPDDILRKGSGTLCEVLLMVEAYNSNVVAPNKHQDPPAKLWRGHLLDSETYIGGHVEALESGVFRSDLPCRFRLDPTAFDELMGSLDDTLKFAVEEEAGLKMEEVTNLEEIRAEIVEALQLLKAQPYRSEKPLIYHVDVGAMYPNIILTNRLQPPSMTTELECATCDYNRPENRCKRHLNWTWRGEYFPINRHEVIHMKNQLDAESFVVDGVSMRFSDMREEDKAEKLKKRVREYSQKAYKRIHDRYEEERSATICQREHPFYVDAVRKFRDRRYEFKAKARSAKKGLESAMASGEAAKIQAAKNLVVLYDSQQLAHKCILNSFYGYVMRKASRWYSMEMAGVVTQTGGNIIKLARELCERVGRPLELDTDGIWVALPYTFPENFVLKTTNKKTPKFTWSYICVHLNRLVNDRFHNSQYQMPSSSSEEEGGWDIRRECSIFFEVDGPYKAMILPASKEEDKRLKKRYAVFNDDGSLAELKGFEVKRRGELKLIKIFQSAVFTSFLNGETLEECYESVGSVANQWLDVLTTKGEEIDDDELLDLISEQRNLSRSVEEYGEQKSTALSTAYKIAEFLGDDMIKGSGLACELIIASKPEGQPVSSRAIPTLIFSADEDQQRHYLRRWLKDNSINEVDIRDVIDWDYYITRLGSAIQKIITIPAAMQGVVNPVPNVAHPEWLDRRIKEKREAHLQLSLKTLFANAQAANDANAQVDGDADGDIDIDIEDVIEDGSGPRPKPKPKTRLASRRTAAEQRQIDAQFASLQKRMEEDEARGYRSDKWSKLKGKGKGKGKNALEDAYTLDTLPKFPPCSPIADLGSWWKYSKLKLKLKRVARKTERAKLDFTNGRGKAVRPIHPVAQVQDMNQEGTDGQSQSQGQIRVPGLRGSVASAKQIARSFSRRAWDIIQIVPEPVSPGIFRMFASIDGRMVQVNLEIPRVFYVQSSRFANQQHKKETKDLVKKSVPRSKYEVSVQEVNMPESNYQENFKLLSSFFAQPDVERVYETQVPLTLRAEIALGAACRVVSVNDKDKDKTLDDTFTLSDFEQLDNVSWPYLQETHLRTSFLYHSQARQGTLRAILSFYDSIAKRGITCIVQDGAASRRPELPSGKHEYRQAYRVWKENSDAQEEATKAEMEDSEGGAGAGDYTALMAQAHQYDPPSPDAFEFDIMYAKSFDDAVSKVGKALTAFCKSGAPSVLIAASPGGRSGIMGMFPFLNAVPVLEHQYNAATDGSFGIGWQVETVRRSLQHYTNTGTWLAERLGFARYSHLPLGNLESDILTQIADVFFARMLKTGNHLLWISPTSKPDLGGLEVDDHRFEDELTNPEIVRPGFYHGACIELNYTGIYLVSLLDGLRIDEQQVSSTVDELSLSGPATALDDNPLSILSSWDQSSEMAATVHILRNLVRSWYQATTVLDSNIASLLLRNFCRWIRNHTARMYEPNLENVIHLLTSNAFSLLLGELNKLGVKIVYASFFKMIIATGKATVADGVAYVDSILETVLKRDLFNKLNIDVSGLWNSLLFMDPHNYGGMNVPLEEGYNGKEGSSPLMEWNIAQYLPKTIQPYFSAVIAEFILKSRTHEATPGSRQDTLVNALGKRLYTMVDSIEKSPTLTGSHVIGSDGHAEAFPTLPGSYLPLQNPALELIKFATHVLSLDADLNLAVSILRRSLLMKIGVSEFGKEATFHNPCLTFVLPDVVCTYCSSVRDLDLTRETDAGWRCECGQPPDKNAIETALVGVVLRRSKMYQLQDLICDKCRSIRIGDLTEVCKCSGKYQLSITEEQFHQGIRVFHRIGKAHGMPWLVETASWILGVDPEE